MDVGCVAFSERATDEEKWDGGSNGSMVQSLHIINHIGRAWPSLPFFRMSVCFLIQVVRSFHQFLPSTDPEFESQELLIGYSSSTTIFDSISHS